MVLGRSLLFAALLACALPARAADPILMFLLGVAQEMAASAIAHAPPPAAPEPGDVYPGTTVPPAVLKRLIDDSFLYLSQTQRGEIFAALHAELMKPANSALRASIIEYFAHRALLVRAAHLRLAGLSAGEKQRLADEFRDALKSIPHDEAEKLRTALERGLLPVPSDLNRLLLAAFD